MKIEMLSTHPHADGKLVTAKAWRRVVHLNPLDVEASESLTSLLFRTATVSLEHDT